jgi:acetyl-CoA carboxylase biotin carboxylase subunit
LNVARVLEAAKQTGAQAVHPGYGFLSESAEFASACEKTGLVFVGPPPESMRRMKDKAEARRLAKQKGVPVVPGSEGVVPDVAHAIAESERIGYPVLCKAAGGGGGIGMAVAHNPNELEKAFRQCTDRAKSAFGREGVYLERYFEAPRHIEVQVLGDATGHLIHLFERECSLQRRHQKVVEEAPSPLQGLPPFLYEAALSAAEAFHYGNAGTVEFLYAEGNAYFMEMNARLQVEHPITERTTGIDLIGWQLKIASGETLRLAQTDVRRSGVAMEFRIYAEDPVKFFPSPGKLEKFRPPEGENLRVDAGYEEGNTVTPYYDPLLAKLVVWGVTRDEVLMRAEKALEGFEVSGIKTNLPLHLRVVRDPHFRAGDLDTRFLEKHAKGA